MTPNKPGKWFRRYSFGEARVENVSVDDNEDMWFDFNGRPMAVVLVSGWLGPADEPAKQPLSAHATRDEDLPGFEELDARFFGGQLTCGEMIRAIRELRRRNAKDPTSVDVNDVVATIRRSSLCRLCGRPLRKPKSLAKGCCAECRHDAIT